MPEEWTGDVLREMHINRVTAKEVAEELGVTKSYISMVMNGKKNPAGMEQRMRDAIHAIVNRRS